MSETFEKNLNVLYWKSKQSFYCSEASAQMFLDYYGYKLDQDYIHQYADRFEVMLPFLNKYVETVELIPNKSLIINSINNKNPVILRTHNEYLHTIVIIGYTANDFIIHDPDQRANTYINQDKLMDISEKIILKREKMSEIEELEKHLADLKKQRRELEFPRIDSHIEELKRYKKIPEYTERPFFREAVDMAIQDLTDAKSELQVKKTEDEGCPECRISVGAGVYLDICRKLDSEKNCQVLFEKVDSGKITVDEFFNIIKEKAKDDPKKLRILEETDQLMAGA